MTSESLNPRAPATSQSRSTRDGLCGICPAGCWVEAGLGEGCHPRVVVEMFGPAVQAGAVAPGGFDDIAHAPVSATERGLQEALCDPVKLEVHRRAPGQVAQAGPHRPEVLRIAHGRPLHRRVGFGDKP